MHCNYQKRSSVSLFPPQPLHNFLWLKLACIIIITFTFSISISQGNKQMDGWKISPENFLFQMHIHRHYLLDGRGNLTCDFSSHTSLDKLISVSFLLCIALWMQSRLLIRIQGGTRLCRDCCVYYAYKVIVQKDFYCIFPCNTSVLEM